ncbi:uncharacterized protein LOC134744860 [Cydia strobilella]|uniref:uncharacterized protein LOC134744860 n=1 Tax=Cydia strobilella TaxID=1100964 RepID=UPI003003C175
MKGKKPAHEIYQDLFIKQKDNELTETFIAKKKTLFAQLAPSNLLESQKLNIMYSSLHDKILEKVPRDTVQTFEELLEAAKRAEESMKPKKRIRCNFCRHVGHTADVCRKKADTDSDIGIGRRWTIRFQIDDVIDEGIVGTAAAACVASHALWNKLKARGYRFTQCHDLVNGEETDFLKVTCNVKFGDRTIPMEFVVFPKGTASENLLGTPLLRQLGVDFGNDIWFFRDEPTKIYPLLKEKPRNDNILRIGLLQFG